MLDSLALCYPCHRILIPLIPLILILPSFRSAYAASAAPASRRRWPCRARLWRPCIYACSSGARYMHAPLVPYTHTLLWGSHAERLTQHATKRTTRQWSRGRRCEDGAVKSQEAVSVPSRLGSFWSLHSSVCEEPSRLGSCGAYPCVSNASSIVYPCVSNASSTMSA